MGVFLTYDAKRAAFLPAGEAKALPSCGGQVQREPGRSTWSLDGPLPASGLWSCMERTGFDGSHQLRILADGSATLDGAPAGKLGASALALLEHGKVTLVSSLPAFQPAPDMLRIGPPEHPTQSLALPGRIVQVVAADLSQSGLDDLLVGVALPDGTSEVYLAERAPP
jgi:hypothetical protein